MYEAEKENGSEVSEFFQSMEDVAMNEGALEGLRDGKGIEKFVREMVEDMADCRELNENSDLFFFSEEKYIKEKPEEYDESRRELLREMPTIESINEFMKALFECAQFSIECCIVCLVYINRVISLTDMPLQPTNWRPLILCALLVA